MAMGIPEFLDKNIKEVKDEDWKAGTYIRGADQQTC
jgi:hypothetical protein